MKQSINIRPTSSVYGTYKRLSYRPWTALAEFIDNSTQSFIDHKRELLELDDYKKLEIRIDYQPRLFDEDQLTITDNAFGMEIEEFERAVVLDRPPKNRNGRNEFGMGLKTAACWFGGKWTVTSTKLGSTNGYSATVDVEKLEKYKSEEIDVKVFKTKSSEHYTIISITSLNQKITGPRTISKVKEYLSSIFRLDLRSGNVSIYYNDTALSYINPDIYEENRSDGSVEKWEKKISFTVPHKGKDLKVNGFVALRKKGSVKDAGLTLIRRGRVIIGGPEKNYRPHEIFQDANSFVSQRLFGELHMDNWPVTQAKDDFDWHDSGLEELFINELKELTKDYKKKAELIRVRKHIPTNTVISKSLEELEKSGIISNSSAEAYNRKVEQMDTPVGTGDEKDSCDESKEMLGTTDGDLDVLITGPSTYKTPLVYNNRDYNFIVSFDLANTLKPWVTVMKCEEVNTYEINMNLKHRFFKPLTESSDFLIVMTRFVIALVLAEIDSQLLSSDGKVDPGEIRHQMNKILQKLNITEGKDGK